MRTVAECADAIENCGPYMLLAKAGLYSNSDKAEIYKTCSKCGSILRPRIHVSEGKTLVEAANAAADFCERMKEQGDDIGC